MKDLQSIVIKGEGVMENNKQIDVRVLHEIYTDTWQFHKKYIDFPNEEMVIRALIMEKDSLLEKYKGNSFAQQMIFTAFKSLISDWKERFTQE